MRWQVIFSPQKDKDSVRIYRWQHCSLTQQPLQKPIVACELGRLYNKESILQMLIDKGEKPPNIRHIKNLKVQYGDNVYSMRSY